MKTKKITIEIEKGFYDQVNEHCKKTGQTIKEAIEKGLLKELRAQKYKERKNSAKR